MRLLQQMSNLISLNDTCAIMLFQVHQHRAFSSPDSAGNSQYFHSSLLCMWLFRLIPVFAGVHIHFQLYPQIGGMHHLIAKQLLDSWQLFLCSLNEQLIVYL